MAYRPRQLREHANARLASFRAGDGGSDDEAGPLSAGWWQTLHDAATDALANGRTDDDVARAIEALDFNSLTEEMAEVLLEPLRASRPALIRQSRIEEQLLRQRMDSIWGAADRRYQVTAYVAYEIGDRVSRTIPADAKLTALLGLHARACRVVAEIRLLTMNGFLAGAEARWRSLHELAVVALLLSEAEQLVAERYLAASAVEQYADAAGFNEKAPQLGYQPYSDDELAAWKTRRDEVIAKFGADIAETNGWAAPLFPQNPNQARGGRPRTITFSSLESLVNLDHLRPFYRLGNHHIHAGPRAAELNIVNRGEQQTWTVGATVFGDIAEISHAALISLLQITTALVSHELSIDESWSIDHLVGLKILQRYVDEAGDLYGAGAENAHRRGLIDH